MRVSTTLGGVLLVQGLFEWRRRRTAQLIHRRLRRHGLRQLSQAAPKTSQFGHRKAGSRRRLDCGGARGDVGARD